MAAIKLVNVWKKFRLPHRKRDTILDNVSAVLERLGGKELSYNEFWALKDISFTLNRGESLGIIGENGCGKTTLLKVIAGILRQDRGDVVVTGRIAPILELGLGFHPELTVIENILVYGSILGLKNREIKDNLESILDFSGLERFKEAKLKNLSSGMRLRLAFATAIEANPDIFLVDEVLAVGDMEFQSRCLDKFDRFKEEKKTIILVSHDMDLVKDFCRNAIYMSEGKMMEKGAAKGVVDVYLQGVTA